MAFGPSSGGARAQQEMMSMTNSTLRDELSSARHALVCARHATEEAASTSEREAVAHYSEEYSRQGTLFREHEEHSSRLLEASHRELSEWQDGYAEMAVVANQEESIAQRALFEENLSGERAHTESAIVARLRFEAASASPNGGRAVGALASAKAPTARPPFGDALAASNRSRATIADSVWALSSERFSSNNAR